MSLQAPIKLQKLQQALHAKAKESPDFRFYALYDKIYREDILAHAYRLVRSNRGKPGVDGEDFPDIEAYGAERWLGELAQALKEKRYRASPVRRVYIPKPNGKQRPLGIPTIRDRVVETAAVLVLAPIVEADLQPEQYAYREGRNAHDAVRHVHKLLNTGYTDVVDADLSGYFDSIPHAELLQSVARRISDRHVLALIKQWLVAPVEEDDGRGRRKRTTQAKDTKRGIPQGAQHPGTHRSPGASRLAADLPAAARSQNASCTNTSAACRSPRHPPGASATVQRLDKQIAKLRQGISRLIDGYSEGYIDKGEFEPRIRRFKERLQDPGIPGRAAAR